MEKKEEKTSGENAIVLQLHHWGWIDAPAFFNVEYFIKLRNIEQLFLSLE